MTFNTIKFLNDYNISYRTKGKNTSIDFVNINCIFCQDFGGHLGIHKTKGYTTCFKCGYHSLESVIKLLVPYENPKEIIKRYNTDYIYETKIHKKLNKVKFVLPGESLKPIHKNYLRKRRFNPDYLEKKYNLKGTVFYGKYRYRLIIPIYFQDEIVTFQTRSLNDNVKPKYIACDPLMELKKIKETVYNLNNCKNNYIVITEGVMKVFRLGDNSCCTFGKNFSIEQVSLLKNYEHIFIYFDPDSAGKDGAKKLSGIFSAIKKEVYIIENDKAPDNLTEEEVKEFWKEVYEIIN